MSIYATLWSIQVEGPATPFTTPTWVTVTAQAVPPHIGSPTPGCGYEDGEPYADFLPPPIETDEMGSAEYNRAVVFVTDETKKGTERSGQEYDNPLLVLTGKEYTKIPSMNSCTGLKRRSALAHESSPNCWTEKGNRMSSRKTIYSLGGSRIP